MTPIYLVQTKRALERISDRDVKTCVIGLGTIGLPLATHLSNAGFYVCGLDVSKSRIEAINNGRVHFEYSSMLRKSLKSAKLRTTSEAKEAIEGSEILFACVPTGLAPDNTLDTTNLNQLVSDFGRHLAKGSLVVFESTLAVGASRNLAQAIERESGLRTGIDFGVAHCPERFDPMSSNSLPPRSAKRSGSTKAVYTLDRVNRVIGGINSKSLRLASSMYRQFVTAEIKEVSSLEVAEAAKLLENTFRDVNIAMINELAKYSSKIQLNLSEVIAASSTKPYGFMPHYPGPGVGGECIPVVPWFFIKDMDAHGVEPRLLRAARDINNSMPEYVVGLLVEELKNQGRALEDSTVTLLGLAYKKNIDDTRFSPSLKVLDILRSRKCRIVLCDPVIQNSKSQYDLIPLERCFKDSDAAMLLTDHDIFRTINFKKVKREMRTPVMIDTRNLFDGVSLTSSGFKFRAVGR